MGYFRLRQTVSRQNPDYEYDIIIEESTGWFGFGYDVEVHGVPKNGAKVHNNENMIIKHYWSRPSRRTWIKLVDKLQQSFRMAQTETDWDAIEAEEAKAKRKAYQEKMDRFLEKARREWEAEEARKAAANANKPVELP